MHIQRYLISVNYYYVPNKRLEKQIPPSPPPSFFFFKEFGTNIFTSSKAMTPDSTSQGVEKENMRLRGKAASVAARCREKEGETV